MTGGGGDGGGARGGSRRVVRVALGVVLALGVMALVGVLTRFEHTPADAEAAVLRLAWRARVPLVEECRRLSEEEQAALPVHMRRDVVCEGRVASYRMVVSVDDTVVHRGTISGAGARGDRPIYVFETLPLAPGRREIVVEFSRVGEAADSTVQSSRAGAETIPARLSLSRVVEVALRDVVLVSYDPVERDLVLR